MVDLCTQAVPKAEEAAPADEEGIEWEEAGAPADAAAGNTRSSLPHLHSSHLLHVPSAAVRHASPCRQTCWSLVYALYGVRQGHASCQQWSTSRVWSRV